MSGPIAASGASIGTPILGAAGGSWRADADDARANTARTLAGIDLDSTAPLVLYVPGTSEHGVPDELRRQVRAQLGPAAQVAAVDYPATWDLRPSVSTGVEVLQEVLDEVAAHDPGRRVMLAGVSQGAWVIGEVMADPERAAGVDRAVLMGHPSPALTHYVDASRPWAAGEKVVELPNPGDTVPRKVHADPRDVLDTISTFGQGKVTAHGLLAALRVVVSDPAYGVSAGINALKGSLLKGHVANPHDYRERMDEAVALLAVDATPGVIPVAGA